jgi:osmotically-inducible protein OsmY
MSNERRIDRPGFRPDYDRGARYREFGNEWSNDDGDPQYYGTGSHYGGGFGTAPSSRSSSSGSLGASGYAGRGAWSDESDWTPEQEGGAEAISHRGRGPKGYLRSDERLRETICERLTDDPRIDASDIEVEVKDQSVTLRGTVDDRRTKYAVEELVDRCGPSMIQNELRTRTRSW